MSDLTGALRAARGHVVAARATAQRGGTQHDHLDHAATDLTHALGIAETESQHAVWSRYQEALDTAHRHTAEHLESLERQSRNVNASHVAEAQA